MMVSVGLAQNFAAMRALSTEGIQKGHMALHARNIAIAAGAPSHSVNECVAFMLDTDRISLGAATEYLEAHQLRVQLEKLTTKSEKITHSPSMFLFEKSAISRSEKTSINVAFKSYGHPVNLLMTQDPPTPGSHVDILFGSKSHGWITKVLQMMDKVRLTMTKPSRTNYILSHKLKILSILMNILTRNLCSTNGNAIEDFLMECVNLPTSPLSSATLTSMGPISTSVQKWLKYPLFQKGIASSLDRVIERNSGNVAIVVGLPLLVSLWQVFEGHIRQSIGCRELAELLLMEQRAVLSSIINRKPIEDLTQFTKAHAKKLQVTLFLLCDAVQFDISLFVPSSFSYISSLGFNLELVQSTSRDLSPSRLRKTLSDIRKMLSAKATVTFLHMDNSFLIWLIARGYSVTSVMELFDIDNWPSSYERNRNLMLQFLSYIETLLVKTERPMYLDSSGIANANRLYQEYYEVGWIGDQCEKFI
jgi:hypothetical protein